MRLVQEKLEFRRATQELACTYRETGLESRPVLVRVESIVKSEARKQGAVPLHSSWPGVWRVLLASVLGLVASMSTARCLAPKPIMTLCYQESGTVSLPDPRVPVAAFGVEMDEAERLIVRRPNYPAQGLITLEHLDLRSDRRPRSTVYTADKYVARPEHSDTAEGLYHLDQGITSTRAPSRDGFQYLVEIPSSMQSVRIKFVAIGVILGMVEKIPILGPRLFRPDVGIWDEKNQRFLWSVPQYENLFSGDRNTCVITSAGMSRQYVVVVQSTREQHDIYVLQVPLASVSPWWHRLVGIVIFAMTLIFLKRFRFYNLRMQ